MHSVQGTSFQVRVLHFRVQGASFSSSGALLLISECFVFDLGCFVFSSSDGSFSSLGRLLFSSVASFSSFGVLCASVFIFECFVFNTTGDCSVFNQYMGRGFLAFIVFFSYGDIPHNYKCSHAGQSQNPYPFSHHKN